MTWHKHKNREKIGMSPWKGQLQLATTYMYTTWELNQLRDAQPLSHLPMFEVAIWSNISLNLDLEHV